MSVISILGRDIVSTQLLAFELVVSVDSRHRRGVGAKGERSGGLSFAIAKVTSFAHPQSG